MESGDKIAIGKLTETLNAYWGSYVYKFVETFQSPLVNLKQRLLLEEMERFRG